MYVKPEDDLIAIRNVRLNYVFTKKSVEFDGYLLVSSYAKRNGNKGTNIN
jgi:hypothetical protein